MPKEVLRHELRFEINKHYAARVSLTDMLITDSFRLQYLSIKVNVMILCLSYYLRRICGDLQNLHRVC